MGLLSVFKRPTTQQLRGQCGEDDALAHLQSHGLRLCERNFRCKGGEIDLIMQDDDVLVFVEVRVRTSAQFGGAAASVTRDKQKRLSIAAQVYLARYKMPPACRFDVIAIDGQNLNWLKNAIDT